VRHAKRVAWVVGLWSLAACSTGRVDRVDTEVRDGITYRAGASQPFTGVIVDPFADSVAGVADDVVWAVTEYREGLSDGMRTEWYPSGAVRRRASFLAGKASGVSKKWYASGQPRSEAEYLRGALHGRLRRWYENGQLRVDRQYLNGFPDGPVREWYENGQPKIEGAYASGHVQGAYRRWYPNGRLALEGEYHRGRAMTLQMWTEEGAEVPVTPDLVVTDSRD
jgi:antitoxin component YwqK of YwqJK toxin-antitoxin module